jgi:hypothetical protein
MLTDGARNYGTVLHVNEINGSITWQVADVRMLNTDSLQAKSSGVSLLQHQSHRRMGWNTLQIQLSYTLVNEISKTRYRLK